MSDDLERRVIALERQIAGLVGDGRLGPQPETEAELAEKAARFVAAATEALGPPKLCTTSGEPVAKVRAEQVNDTGQHKGYVVLCEDERKKGFVRPYRDAYKHLSCGSVTTMGRALSETYARDPKFYNATFCVNCNKHLPLTEFVWTADGEQVGS